MPNDISTARGPRRRTRPPARLATFGASVAAFLAMAGCRAGAGPISEWLAARNAPVAASAIEPDGQKPTLMSRWMARDRTPFTSGRLGATSVYLGERGWEKTRQAADPTSEAEFAVARKLYDDGKLVEAEPLFARLASREIKNGTPWGEKAQYYLAETQFRRQKFRDANDSFEKLFQKYPGTDYVDEIVNREYQIAQIWLSDEDPKVKPMPWQARFDGRMHLVDNRSYAVKALDHVRLHDPLGPLADDAALRTADHYHNIGDYELAAVYYDQLIVEHPKSPYKERALLSSIDSKMKAYVGPEYDFAGLESARELVKRTANEFPERMANLEGLDHTRDLIDDADAERNFTIGQYYVRARKPISAEYYFGMVQARWPRSKWAAQAKQEMARVAKAPRKASVPSKIMTLPGAPDPGSMNAGPGGGLGGGLGGGGASSAGGGMGAPY